MKKIALAFLILCLISCSNDDDFRQTTGNKLLKIEYSRSNMTINNWVESYSYTNSGILDKVEDFYSLGRRYQMEYENNLLSEFSTYVIDTNVLAFRDSIGYNSNGTIKEIYKFNTNSGTNLSLSSILEFKYDDQDRVSEKKIYYVLPDEYTSVEKFYWGNANIERVEYYNGEEKLFYEYFYSYDDKINYKKELPIYMSNPINWSENNVTEMTWIDYLGNLDLTCRPCTAEYKYNLDKLPISIKNNTGIRLNLIYE